TAASVVDDRTGRPWEVLVHDADGRPTFEALEQRQNDYMGRSWEEAYATARRKAELYPDQIRSWDYLEFFEREVLGEAAADSAANVRRPMTQALLAAYREAPTVPADELATIVFRAWAQNDTAAWDYWWERTRREAPHHPQTAQQAALRARMKYPRNSAHDLLLVDFEEIWERHGPVVGDPGNALFQMALYAANEAKDVSAYRRWAHRSMAGDPSIVSHYASTFLRYPELRDEGLAILRRQLRGSQFASYYPRPLGSTREAYRRVFDRDRRRLLGTIGRALLDAGNQRGGLDTLALAVSDGWDLALFQDVAAARMTAGDTVGALAIEAKVTADPRTSEVRRDSLAQLGTRVLGARAWADSVANAGLFMSRTMMASAVLRHFSGDPELTDSTGRVIRLRDLIAGRPALVVYWSRFCGPALEALPRIDSVATVLRGQGVPAFLIMDEPPSAALTAFLKEHQVSTPVYHETRREASKAFRNFGTPAYYVLDPAGRIRFTRASTEDELLVQVAAVRDEQPGP
ncbi:MAG: TlpA disulfide reductase family protein, partial [Patescibacteria group bacterium]